METELRFDPVNIKCGQRISKAVRAIRQFKICLPVNVMDATRIS
jgi:hypothetical protein